MDQVNGDRVRLEILQHDAQSAFAHLFGALVVEDARRASASRRRLDSGLRCRDGKARRERHLDGLTRFGRPEEPARGR